MHLQGVRTELSRHISDRIEQRVQFECADRTLDSARQPERPVNAFGRDARNTRQLIGADLGDELGVGACSLAYRDDERQVQQVHLQTDLVGDAHQGRVRELGEVDVGHQLSRIVRTALRRQGRSGRVPFWRPVVWRTTSSTGMVARPRGRTRR